MPIDEKRLANKRFRRTEDVILRIFLKKSDITASEMSKKMGVARSSLYYHHKSVRKIVPDYEKFILKQYKKMIKEAMKMPNVRVKIIYLKTLYFTRSNQQFFVILIENDGDKIFHDMLKVIRKKLTIAMGLPKNSQTLFEVYTSEVAKVMREWGGRGFKESEIDKVLEQMMFLTGTARMRLKVLLD